MDEANDPPGQSMFAVRGCKIALVAAVALFFTLVTCGNIADYGSNWQFVQHVLSMDTTFAGSSLRGRAIADPAIHKAAYTLIIATEAGVAALLWLGVVRLAVMIRAREFAGAKTWAVVGLTAGLLLYMAGFVAVGGEWFAMWQSQVWNGQQTAFGFITMIGVVLIVVLLPEG